MHRIVIVSLYVMSIKDVQYNFSYVYNLMRLLWVQDADHWSIIGFPMWSADVAEELQVGGPEIMKKILVGRRMNFHSGCTSL